MLARIIIAALALGLIVFAAVQSAKAHDHTCHRHATAGWHCH